MIKRIFIMMIAALVYYSSAAQVWHRPDPYYPDGRRSSQRALHVGETMHIPAGETPALGPNGWEGSGAIFVDTINHRFYVWSGGFWRYVGDTSHLAALNTTWGLAGNSGLNSSNFLGTTDSSSVGITLRVGNEPHGAIGYEYQATNNPYSHYRPHQVGIVALGSHAGDSAIKDLRAGLPDRTQITAIGSGALQNNIADANTAVGSSSMNRMVTGRRNTAVGIGTLWDAKTGRFNTAFGTFALEVQDGVDESSAFGHEALRSNKNGVRNAAFGTYALTFNTTYVDTLIITAPGFGYTNATITIAAPDTATPGAPSTQATATAIIDAGGIVGATMTNKGRGYNIKDGPVTVTITGDGTGATATATLSSGNDNTGVGFMALYNSRYGKRNTAVGTYSGMGSSGTNFRSLYDDDMTFLGYNARRHSGRANTVPYSNGAAIGSNAIVGCDNCLILGDSSLANVGIGTAFVNHSARLQVNSTTRGALLPRLNTSQMNAISTPAAGLLLYNTDSSSYVQYTGSAWQRLGGSVGGGTPGIDDVLAEGQLLTSNRTIDLDTRRLTITGGKVSAHFNYSASQPYWVQVQYAPFTKFSSYVQQADDTSSAVGLLAWNGAGTASMGISSAHEISKAYQIADSIFIHAKHSNIKDISDSADYYVMLMPKDQTSEPKPIAFTHWMAGGGGGGSSDWGDLGGTLSDQTDLQSALDAKVSGSLTSGRVPFATGSNTISDDANFTWDNSNKKLLIGNGTSTTGILTVNGGNQSGVAGQIIVQNNGTSQGSIAGGNLGFTFSGVNNRNVNVTSLGTGNLTLTSQGSTGITYNSSNAAGAHIFQANGSTRATINTNGSLDLTGDNIRIATNKTPASSTAAGTTGQICWDSNYIYVCIATNTWVRSALTTW